MFFSCVQLQQFSMKDLNMFKYFMYPARIIFIPAYAHWKRVVIVFAAQLMHCILVVLTVYYVIRVIFQTNGVRMWLDREEENWVLFLLFSCYTWKLRELALLVIPILAHTCWVHTFLCLLMIFFIPFIREKFEFNSHSHSWSFTNDACILQPVVDTHSA